MLKVMSNKNVTELNDITSVFLDWLSDGINDGSISFNTSGSLVHFVDDGLFLNSPRVFRVFVRKFKDLNITYETLVKKIADDDLFKRTNSESIIFKYRVIGFDRVTLAGCIISSHHLKLKNISAVNEKLVMCDGQT